MPKEQPLFFIVKTSGLAKPSRLVREGKPFFIYRGLHKNLYVGCAESVGGVYSILALQAAYTTAAKNLAFVEAVYEEIL